MPQNCWLTFIGMAFMHTPQLLTTHTPTVKPEEPHLGVTRRDYPLLESLPPNMQAKQTYSLSSIQWQVCGSSNTRYTETFCTLPFFSGVMRCRRKTAIVLVNTFSFTHLPLLAKGSDAYIRKYKIITA